MLKRQRRERLRYSQNEDDDTRSRYEKIPSDDGSQFSLGRVQDRWMDGLMDGFAQYTIHKEESWEKKLWGEDEF